MIGRKLIVGLIVAGLAALFVPASEAGVLHAAGRGVAHGASAAAHGVAKVIPGHRHRAARRTGR